MHGALGLDLKSYRAFRRGNTSVSGSYDLREVLLEYDDKKGYKMMRIVCLESVVTTEGLLVKSIQYFTGSHLQL